MFAIGTVLTVGSGYIAADIGLTITNYFQSSPAENLYSAWLFSLTIVFPGAAALIYFLIQSGVVVRVLKEKKPLCASTPSPRSPRSSLSLTRALARPLAVTLLGAAFAFALGQAAQLALSHRICTGTNAKIDGSWIGTLLETVTIGLIYAAWQMVTEDEWDVRLLFLSLFTRLKGRGERRLTASCARRTTRSAPARRPTERTDDPRLSLILSVSPALNLLSSRLGRAAYPHLIPRTPGPRPSLSLALSLPLRFSHPPPPSLAYHHRPHCYYTLPPLVPPHHPVCVSPAPTLLFLQARSCLAATQLLFSLSRISGSVSSQGRRTRARRTSCIHTVPRS